METLEIKAKALPVGQENVSVVLPAGQESVACLTQRRSAINEKKEREGAGRKSE